MTLHAPSRYGKRDFLGWVKGGRAGEDVPLAEKELLRERSLTLDLRKTSDYIVEPVYAPVTETPVNDKGEEWPACPVGWVFDDWVFVNGTASELTIDRIIYGTPTKEQVPAAVNEPQGDTIVKLSFERLKLLKGESSKLSVCIKPDGSGTNFTAFGWRADSENYQVNFSVEGRPGDLKKDGHPGSALLDVDNENRILTFAHH